MAKGTLQEALDFLGYVNGYEVVAVDSAGNNRGRELMRTSKEVYEKSIAIAKKFMESGSYRLTIRDLWVNEDIITIRRDILIENGDYNAHTIAMIIINAICEDGRI